MPIELPPGEPLFAVDRVVPVSIFAAELVDRISWPTGRAGVIAIDGRSGSGKSTVARALARHLDGAVVIGTDDLAWHHSFFDWASMLVNDVLEPVHAGRAVEFRPPAWRARGRPGAITVPPGTRFVVIEGVGAARREAEHLIDLAIWVQSDIGEAERRGIARDGGDPAAVEFWHEWMAVELPFIADQRPWERVDVVLAGTTRTVQNPTGEIVVYTQPQST